MLVGAWVVLRLSLVDVRVFKATTLLLMTLPCLRFSAFRVSLASATVKLWLECFH
jgi:hypothetical protein